MGTWLAYIGGDRPHRRVAPLLSHDLVYHWIVNALNCKWIWENCVLADVLATDKGRNGLAAFCLAKLKAFFDRDEAMVWPEAATTEQAGNAGQEKRVTERHKSRAVHLS